MKFLPETDDLREAPSLVNIPILLDDGAKVYAWDPVGVSNYKRFYPNEITYCQSIEQALQDAELCLIFTEWADVKALKAETFRQLMKTPIVLDGRNCFSLDQFRDTGVVYDSVGRGVVK